MVQIFWTNFTLVRVPTNTIYQTKSKWLFEMGINGLITAYVNFDYCCFACRKIISSEVAAGINTQFYSIID